MTNNGKTIGVTGIAGFIGLKVAERALSLGYKVKGMDINQASVNNIVQGLKKESKNLAQIGDIFTGNIVNHQDVKRLCEGVDIMIHTAAIVSEDSTMEECRKVNVLGTSMLAEECSKAKVSHFIHFSSVMVYGFTYEDQVNETGPFKGEGNPYCQTKIESEIVAMYYHRNPLVHRNENGENTTMKVTIIRPGDVYGVGSVWVQRPLDLLKRNIFTLPTIKGKTGLINHVYVDNLLDAVFLCINNPNSYGEVFNVTDGQKTTLFEFYSKLASIYGTYQPKCLSATIMYIIFLLVEILRKFLPNMPPASTNSILFLTRENTYSIEKARRILHYKPSTSLDQGIKTTTQLILSQKNES